MREDGRQGDSALDTEMLPAELHALHWRLVQDGVVWRAQLTSSERLSASLAAMVELSPRARSREGAAATQSEPLARVVRPDDRPPSSQHDGARRRTRGLVGAAAAIVIVGLMGALLGELSAGRIGTQPLAKATATTTVSAPQRMGQWVRVFGLPGSESPLIAPSDPRVVYIMAYPHIRRTDDDGQTWHELPVPAGTTSPSGTSGSFYAMISPLDAHTVFLLASFPSSGPDGAPCQSNAGAQAHAAAGQGQWLASLSLSGPTCTEQYYTTDGGQHWHADHLPLPGMLGFSYGNGPATPLQTQGGRLYDTITPPLQGTMVTDGVRLVTSADGGVSWRIADGPIAAGGGLIMSYAVAPGGETIFAEVADDVQSRGVIQLWRSDDAGANWAKLPPAPFANPKLVAVVDAGGRQLIYADTSSGMGAAISSPGTRLQAGILQVSADGGHTWTASPALELPSNLWAETLIAGVMDDGSIVVPFMSRQAQQNYQQETSVTFSAWKLGQPAWRQIAPALRNGNAFLYPAGPWGPEALWGSAVSFSSQGTATISLWRCPVG